MAGEAGCEGGRPPRFVCDEMMKRLARWLRAAGYDTVVPEDGARDRAVLARALEEGRLVITRDRKLTELKGADGAVLLVRSNTLQGAAAELTETLGLDWLYRPFSRCLVCNAALAEADERVRARLPEGARSLAKPLRHCPSCARLYWAGGHVRRMRARLEAWSLVLTFMIPYHVRSFFPFPRQEGMRRRCGDIAKHSRRPEGAGKATRWAAFRGPRRRCAARLLGPGSPRPARRAR